MLLYYIYCVIKCMLVGTIWSKVIKLAIQHGARFYDWLD